MDNDKERKETTTIINHLLGLVTNCWTNRGYTFIILTVFHLDLSTLIPIYKVRFLIVGQFQVNLSPCGQRQASVWARGRNRNSTMMLPLVTFTTCSDAPGPGSVWKNEPSLANNSNSTINHNYQI